MIKQIKNGLRALLPESAFARGVGVLVSGTAGAQALSILAAPLLTRLYRPEDFGLVAVYAGLLALIGVVSSLRYELAIPLPENDQDAANVVVLSLVIVFGTTLLSVPVVIFLGDDIAKALDVPVLARYLWLLPIGVLLGGIYTIFNYWSIRTKHFSTIAGTKLKQVLATIAIQLAAYKLGGIALLLAQVAGQSVGTTSLAKPALARPVFRQVSWRGIRQAAERYRQFPIFSTWAGLINTAGHQLPPLMFAALFSAGAAGFYALAHRVLMLPASLIGSAIGNVFFSHASVENRKGELGILYAKVQDKLVQIGLPPALFLIVAGPELFAIIFGENWRIAGHFAQWLAVGAFAGFVVSPLSMVFTILEKQHVGLVLQAVLFSGRLAAILVGAWMGDLLFAVAFFSIASLFGYSIYIFMMSRYIKSSLLILFKSFVVNLFYSLILLIPVFLSLISKNNLFFYLAISISLLMTLVYYFFIYKNKHFLMFGK